MGSPLDPLVEIVFSLILKVVVWVLIYAVALPILWIAFTPVVLINALFGPGPYVRKILSGYKGVRDGWLHFGPGLPPN